MNLWTKRSIDFANQHDYLDQLFKVYPMSPNERRHLPEQTKSLITKYFNDRKNEKLIDTLLDLEIFPLKDSYVAYLKRDRSSISRNPQTINRLAGNLYNNGLDFIFDK